ncbi:hypothetical protein LIER_24854 [Lithospermum erythrorhizon]|uniref:Retrovirus-related Pol polyprotein from transposon TNT 1-94-like beta-barrel domain-containing protein n=1 Tax=Lithospermum erythrorhizon TaxID=34254 RepID=A0AAV3R5Y4_LITER
MDMEYYLYGKELNALLGDKLDNYDDEAWKKLDRRVLSVIRPRLSRNVAADIAKVTTTKELMKAFCDEGEVNNCYVFSAEKGRTRDRDFRNSGSSQFRRKSNSDTLVCWGCGKMGDMEKHCKAKGETRVEVSIYSDILVLDVNVYVDSWVVDSETYFHTTHDRNIMENYIASNFGTVHFTDSEQLNVVGIGDVNLRLSNGSTWKLTNVRYVLKLGKNLISVSQLDGDGYRTTCADGHWKVVREAMVIIKGQKSDTLYLTDSSQKNMSRGSGETYSQPLDYLLTVEGCSDQIPRVNELDQRNSYTWNGKTEEKNSLMTNQAWRFSKVPGKKAKTDQISDVLRLVKKILKLGSASVEVFG